MTKFISNANIYKMAQDVKSYVENNAKYLYKGTYGGVEFTWNEMQDIMTYCLLNLNNNCNAGTYKWCENAHGDTISEEVLKADYLDQAKRVHNYILKNGQVPNYVTTVKSKKKVQIDLFTYCVAKILVYYKNHGQLPNYCVYQSSVFDKKKTPVTPSVKSAKEVLAYFIQVFGNVTCIDDALEKWSGRGYAYYYDDNYTNKEAIDRVKKGWGINCVDACHVIKNVADALGIYKAVDVIHVKCRGGDGHVRLRITQKNGNVFYRDPACTLDKNTAGTYCNWCTSGYTLLAVNPSWFMNNLFR